MAAWEKDGFFTGPGLVSRAEVAAIEDEVIGAVRADPPAAHTGKGAHFMGLNLLTHLATAASPNAANPEAPERRAAMVFHYGRAGARLLDPARAEALARVNRWIPVRRTER